MVVVVAVVVVAVIVLIDYYLSLYQVVRWLVEQKHVGALVGEEGVVERMGSSALWESKSCTLIFMLARFFLFSFPKYRRGNLSCFLVPPGPTWQIRCEI